VCGHEVRTCDCVWFRFLVEFRKNCSDGDLDLLGSDLSYPDVVLLMLVRRDVILLLLGVVSVALPVVRICLVTEHKKRFKRELPMILFGLFMVAVSLMQAEELVFFVCSMTAFAIAALYLLWGLLTLKPRLDAYAEWEAEMKAREAQMGPDQ
jgi:hypothetical protein